MAALQSKGMKDRLATAELLIAKDKAKYAAAAHPDRRAGLKDNDLNVPSWAMDALC